MEFVLKNFETAVEVEGVANIIYCELDKQYRTGKEKPQYRELIYVDNGCLEIEAEHYTGVIGKNQAIIHQVGESHVLTCSPEGTANVIIIGFTCDNELLDKFALVPMNLTAALRQLLAEIVREGRSVFYSPFDVPDAQSTKRRRQAFFGAEQMIKLKMETFLIELIRQSGLELASPEKGGRGSDIGIQEICKYINENYKDKITLNDLCFLFNTNKTSLCSRFKDACGTTVIGYINTLRLEEAKRLLREGNFNLTEIADKVGFSSIHYFSKVFKQHEKVTPSYYIKSVRTKSE